MDHHNGSPGMPAAQSYPSPSAVAVGEGAAPFFAHQQQRLSPPDDLRLPAHMSRAHAPVMSGHHHGVEGGLMHHAGPAAHDPAFGDPNAPRKRSKVSRACDECRRKKIRCDATSESGMEQCSSCKRVGGRCQFSRVPMKRGPSKGYIKELADRLNTLENSIIPAQSGEMQYTPMDHASHSPRATDGFSPPPIAGSDASGHAHARKRTYSLSNDPGNGPYLQTLPQRPSIGAWSAHETSRHLPHPASSLPNPQTPQPVADMNHARPHHAQFSPNGVSQSFWKHGSADLGRRESMSLPGESSENRAGTGDPNHADAILEWNERMVDQYYEVLHPIFPLLPHSKARLRSRLANCPLTLREAFLEALEAAVRSSSRPSGPSSPELHGTKKAADLLAASQFESHATRTASTNLVYLQTMILMAIEADNRGPPPAGGQFGPPRSVWLGAAMGLAYSLRLHGSGFRDRPGTDDDSDERLGRRDWLVLVMLDRWHASSTSSPMLVADSSVAFVPDDQTLLGELPYHLARISIVIGHIAEVCVTGDEAAASSTSNNSLISKLLRGEIERFRESIDTVMGSLGLVQLAYWHATLLVKLITPNADPYEILASAQYMANLLHSSGTPFTPLHHHFAALAALTLVGLVDTAETKEGALSGLQTLYEAVDRWRGSAAAPQEDVAGWDVAIRDLIMKKQLLQHQEQPPSSAGAAATTENQGGLQHLADLAVGERGQKETNGAEPTASAAAGGAGTTPSSSAAAAAAAAAGPSQHAPDVVMLMRNGYLTMLTQE